MKIKGIMLESKNKNIIISIAIVAVLCVGTFAAVTFMFPSDTLHYERNYTGDKPVSLMISGLEDCVLTLGYEDNEDLMYRIDIELYDASETIYFDYRGNGIGSYQHFVEINGGSHFGSTTRARTMNIILGSGHPYLIYLGGDSNSRNVTSNIVIDNNATLGDEEFAYLFPGSLNLVFTEDVDYSQGGLLMDIGKSNEEIVSVVMNVDLPDGMDGYVRFISDSMSISSTGWTLYDTGINPTSSYYRTSVELDLPLLDIDQVFGDTISATLSI